MRNFPLFCDLHEVTKPCTVQSFSWLEPNVSNITDYNMHMFFFGGDYLVVVTF